MERSYDDTDTIVLHRFFERHADKIGKELLSSSKVLAEKMTPEAEAAAANEDDAAAAEPTEQPTAAAAAVSDFLPLHPPRPSPYLSLKITMLIHFFISQ